MGEGEGEDHRLGIDDRGRIKDPNRAYRVTGGRAGHGIVLPFITPARTALRTIPLPGNRRAQSPRVPCSGAEAGRRQVTPTQKAGVEERVRVREDDRVYLMV